jgi:putative phosphonate metabolism protein
MTPPATRVALYWAPDRADPLWDAGNRWLGRDPEHNADLPQPPHLGMAEITEAARQYGFHATLRPPMRLATGWDEFLAAAEGLAETVSPFDLPPLRVENLDGFLALRETAPCPALHALADTCVRGTDRHRLPPSEAELARRRAAGLSDEEERLLQLWGYPYVMQRWRFHMTLSRRLTDAEMATWRPAAEAHFTPVLALPRRVQSICVFTQRPGEAFVLAERLPLRHSVIT